METKFSFRTRNDRAALRALCRAADKDLRLTRNRRKLYVGFAVVFSLLLVLRGLRLAQAGLEPLLPAGKLGELVLLGVCAALGAAVYFLLSALLRLEEMDLARALFRKLRKRG